MTFDECQDAIAPIRQRQGTARPFIRVDYGGTTYRGLISRDDSSSYGRSGDSSPFGLLVLDQPGLVRAPQTILQIACIAPGSIQESDEA